MKKKDGSVDVNVDSESSVIDEKRMSSFLALNKHSRIVISNTQNDTPVTITFDTGDLKTMYLYLLMTLSAGTFIYISKRNKNKEAKVNN